MHHTQAALRPHCTRMHFKRSCLINKAVRRGHKALKNSQVIPLKTGTATVNKLAQLSKQAKQLSWDTRALLAMQVGNKVKTGWVANDFSYSNPFALEFQKN